MKKQTYFWIREGDNDNYQRFSSLGDIDMSCWGTFDYWNFCGLVTSQFRGENYISLFVGDKNAQRIRQLNKAEKTFMQNNLTKHHSVID
jgi:hypothetical protein